MTQYSSPSPKSSVHSLYFDFYGTVTRLSVTQADIDAALFYFGGQRMAPVSVEETDVQVTLDCIEWPSRGFFTSLLRKDGLAKRIQVDQRIDSQWQRVADHTFTTWSSIPSPLPPFRHSSLWNTLAVAAGTCLCLPDGSGLLLTGDNYVGKTSTALELCDRGARLVSDSLAVLNVKTGYFLRHDSPIGFRGASRRQHLAKITSFIHQETVSPDTGLVLLARPGDVLNRPNLNQAKVQHVVRLVRHEAQFGHVSWQETDISRWFSGVDPAGIRNQLPLRTRVVTVHPEATPSETAQQILVSLGGALMAEAAC
ncbi:hypothetical protein [Streptomyces syringium]|uniref:hypothetical protein n=1 Tax=Streptomyces syringium TaxID=76729 RepID=UPI0033C5B6D4